MKPKKERLKNSRLYAIIDKETHARLPLPKLLKKILKYADIIQLRDKLSDTQGMLKEAMRIKQLLGKGNKLFLVNDSIEVARLSDCDGVHLGQRDVPLKKARKIMGRDKLIGISCHNLKQALKAQREGADYLGFGPVFTTALKAKRRPVGFKGLRELKRKIKIPYFVIGGVNCENLARLLSSGATRIAVCRAVSQIDKLHDRIRIGKK